MNYDREKCDVCKIDSHRASMSRHLKSKKNLENTRQNKVIIPKKNPIKSVVKEEIKVSDIDTEIENQYYSTDKNLKIAYDINLDNDHNKHANSQITIISKFNNIVVDIIHIKKIMEEMSHTYAKLTNQY